jgi:hypothetical protein
MTTIELNKHKVDLSKRGCVPAKNYNARWSCSYGNNGISIVKHNYMTKNDALISVYDIYIKGVYECTFDTKKSAMEYVEGRDKCIVNEKEEV